MATLIHRSSWRFASHAAAFVLALGIFLLPSGRAWTQEDASPVRTQQALRLGIELYKTQQYEQAALYFGNVQPNLRLLSPDEARDFNTFSAQNGIALRSRQDGAARIKLASQALTDKNAQEATNILRSLNANQFLTAADRQQVDELNAKLRAQAGTVIAQGKTDAKSLLAAGRTALTQGDLATAEAMAAQADKASSLIPLWMQPWNDSPAKLRRDIQAARAKLTPPTPEPVKTDADVDANKSKGFSFWPFGGSSTPAKTEKAASDRRVDEMMARKMIVDAYGFLDTEPGKAHFIALKVKELNVTYQPGERTPDDLIRELDRRKGVNTAKPNDPPPVLPQPEPLPTSNDPRVLLKHGRALLEKKKFDEADKVCNLAESATNARWGLFEDNPDKLRRDILTRRQSSDRDLSVKLMVEARQALTQGNLDDAEKKAYRAQQLHGPYGVFDFGDRPNNLLQEINRARLARGTTPPANDKQIANHTPAKGVPFEMPASVHNANKNRAIVMVREARELERQGMLWDARQKAMEARDMKASFLPDEDSPDNVIWSLSAKCDKQISLHLHTAIQHAANTTDQQRFQKAYEQLVAARKMADMFQLDATRIEQVQVQLQQVATGARAITQVGLNGLPSAPALDAPTGDPKKDQLRKFARERLYQAQVELSHGKTGQARMMAEQLCKEEFGIQKEALALIRSIDAEEYNQKILEARRNFEAGIEAYVQKDYRRARSIFQHIDVVMLPEQYQARLRDFMSTREMQPEAIAQVSERTRIQPSQIGPKGPSEPNGKPAGENLIDDVLAKEAVLVQMMRQRGQEALRAANELYKVNQKEEAIKTLKAYVAQVDSYQFDRQKANELKRFSEQRIQHYQADIADAKLRGAAANSKYVMFHDENARQAEIKKRQTEMVEKMKVVHDLMKNNKYKEAEIEVRKLRDIDPENLAVIAALHIITNKIAQDKYDGAIRRNERLFDNLLDPDLNPTAVATYGKPIGFDPKHAERRAKDGSGSIAHPLSDPVEREIEYRLRKPISLHFKNVPLEQAIRDLSAASGVQVVPDYRALQSAKINLDSPLSITVDNINMKSALNIMLDQLGLTYIIQDQVLKITTEDKTKGRLVRVTYPIADLIVVVPDHPMPDVLNLQKAIERAMQPNQAFGGYLTPPAYPMGAGQPVSTHGDTLGGAFGGRNTNGAAGSQNQPAKDKSKEAMAEVLKELIQNTVAKNSWESMGGTGAIQYFPMGMALVINQTQEVQEEVMLLLATLRRLQDLQVSVELRAVLVSETFFERIGVDFDMNIRTPTSRREPDLIAGTFVPPPFVNRTGAGLGRLISGLTSTGNLTPDLGIPIRSSSFNFTTPTFGGYQPEAGLTLGLAFLSDIQVFMFLEAVQGDRRAHIMQAPKLTVFNGQQATIFGSMGRFGVTGVTPIALGNGQLVMQPQPTFFPFGMGMTVQPVVSPDRRFIRLNVTPMTGQGMQDPAGGGVIVQSGAFPAPFSPGTPGGIQPLFANNPLNVSIAPMQVDLTVVNTTVNVPDGGTVLLGGFKFLAEERTEYGPPVLSKIPYLSRLFRNVGWSRDGSTLIYLVTARIIMVEEEERLFLGEIQPIPGR